MRDLQPSNFSFGAQGVLCEFTVRVQGAD
jgi:hypothetical protein